jgi:hypothetical protein
MMAVFVPGANTYAKCSICDAQASHVAKITIKIADQATGKEIITNIEFPVCHAHSKKMDIQIDKKIVSAKKKLIIP